MAMIPRLHEANVAELTSLLESAVNAVARQRESIELTEAGSDAFKQVSFELSSKLFQCVRYGYAAGVDLHTLREQMRESSLVASAAGASPGPSYMLRLFGLYEELVPAPVVSASASWLFTIEAYFYTGERGWLGDVGYPRNDWQREQCEYVDQVVDDPANAARTIAQFLNAWVDERAAAEFYMAFEVAALAKMHGVGDSALIEHPRYPYELAHFLD